MIWFVASAAALLVTTLVAGRVATLWPRPGRDVAAALLATAGVAFWVALDGAHNGPTLACLPGGHVVGAADLVALPALALAGLLMGRTVILAPHRAAVAAGEQTRRQPEEPDASPASSD